MCSYCGCEAEPSITALTEDHAVIADLAYQLNRLVHADYQEGDADGARTLLADLAERFRVHSLREEQGLFAELAAAGEATGELRRLLADHRRLRPLLASPDLVDQPGRLRATLAELAQHAETEDNDLFPYALQTLPAEKWDRINRAVTRGGRAHNFVNRA